MIQSMSINASNSIWLINTMELNSAETKLRADVVVIGYEQWNFRRDRYFASFRFKLL